MEPKLGMPVILMPFLTTQSSSAGSSPPTTSLRSGGLGFRPSENFAHFTPGPPWQLTQPRAAKARAPICTTAGSSTDMGGTLVAWWEIEASRMETSVGVTMAGSCAAGKAVEPAKKVYSSAHDNEDRQNPDQSQNSHPGDRRRARHSR